MVILHELFSESKKVWFRGMSLWTRCMNNSRLEKKKAGNQRLGVQAGLRGEDPLFVGVVSKVMQQKIFREALAVAPKK